MKAMIYARTATRKKTRHGNSIRAQTDACRKYAKENGFVVVDVFTDAGFSGIKLDRPALNKMRRLIARDSIDAVIVLDPSRLTRSVTENITLEREFAKRGTRVECVLNSGRKTSAQLRRSLSISMEQTRG